MGRREEIQRAAYDLMGVEGLETVHARTVAQKLDINHATVHYYYPTRADLLVGVAEFAALQIESDRKSLDLVDTGREGIESELSLAEAYSRAQSRLGRVVIGLAAASVAEPKLVEPLQKVWEAFARVGNSAIPETKIRKSCPYVSTDLFACSLFGIVAGSHITHQKISAEDMVEAMHSSFFKK